MKIADEGFSIVYFIVMVGIIGFMAIRVMKIIEDRKTKKA